MNNTKANGLQNANFLKISVLVLFELIKFGKQFYTSLKALWSQNKAKKPLRKIKHFRQKTMNNTKANGLKIAHF